MRLPIAQAWAVAICNAEKNLLSALRKVLRDECKTPLGFYIPLPRTDGQDDLVTMLRADIKKAEGSALIVELMAEARQAAPGIQRVVKDWESMQFGPDPPSTLAELHGQVHRSVQEAYGILPELFSTSGSSSGSREGWRPFLFSVVRLLANGVQSELSTQDGSSSPAPIR
ncbi:MAG: hypothetical protein OXI44_02705 [Bacteroidota bacterium]|nr:hypothetical protein [Bacteroidota bacterium]